MNISNINGSYAQSLYQQQSAANNALSNANADANSPNATGNENNPNQTAVTSPERSQNSGNAAKEQNSQNGEQTNEKGEKVNANGLSEAEQRQVNELAATDAHVKAHEAAHKSAGGGLAGAASYSYERGPDNKMYAVAGEVSISIGGGNTPQEKLSRAQQVRRAALAPSDPSPQDLKVAAQAISMEMDARAKIAEQKQSQNEQSKEQSSGEDNTNETSGASSTQNSDPNANNVSDTNTAQTPGQNDFYKAPDDNSQSMDTSIKTSNPYTNSTLSKENKTDDIGMF